MLDPYSEEIRWLCYAFCWHGLGPLVPLKGRVTANQYKVVLSHHLYPMMKHFYPDGVVSSKMTMPKFTGHEGSLNALMSMKMM